jgi:hypothetical protein
MVCNDTLHLERVFFLVIVFSHSIIIILGKIFQKRFDASYFSTVTTEIFV